MSQWLKDLDESGAVVVERVLSHDETCRILEIVNQSVSLGGRAGSRRLHELAFISDLATTGPLASLARCVLGASARAVRVLWFDKTPESNWSIRFHQDLTIAVKERADLAGYVPWSVKDGIPHVQPPARVLEAMLAVRLHLDDCLSANGPLRVASGSHGLGKIPEQEIGHLVKDAKITTLEAKIGDAVLMRPLALHASSPSTEAAHRRVLHIEYAATELEDPLEWFLDWPTEDSADTGRHRLHL